MSVRMFRVLMFLNSDKEREPEANKKDSEGSALIKNLTFFAFAAGMVADGVTGKRTGILTVMGVSFGLLIAQKYFQDKTKNN